ncbi:DUF4158 domain-containing protein [Streptomyces bobili]|uniref:DUF4158 domain-containing protein n=1 Tax=Streptomyces bobili TaxID=67280 RepID=UPI0033A59BF5
MGRDLGLDEVVDHFTLSGDEAGWLRNKTGATRLGFAVQLKFLTWRGRFPRMRLELPPDAVEHVAKQVGVAASELGFYDFTSRAAKRHRSELWDLTGWHEFSLTDQVKLISQLVDVIWHDERREEQVRAELGRQMRVDLIEPPIAAQVDAIIRSALHQADERAVAEVAMRLARKEDCPRRLDALVFTDPTADSEQDADTGAETVDGDGDGSDEETTWSRCSPTSSPIRATSASTRCWTRYPSSSRSAPSASRRRCSPASACRSSTPGGQGRRPPLRATCGASTATADSPNETTSKTVSYVVIVR